MEEPLTSGVLIIKPPQPFTWHLHKPLYYVTVTNALGCTTVKLITLNVHPNPTATVIGETSICQGETTMLTAGGGDSYVWSTGEQTAGIEVSTQVIMLLLFLINMVVPPLK